LHNHEDEKYLDIREKIRNLPKITASDDFVTKLQHRINTLEADLVSTSIHHQNTEKLEKGFFSRFFGEKRNPWLVPAMGFTVLIFLILIVVYNYNISTNNETATTQVNTNTPENITQQNNTTNQPNTTNNNNGLTSGNNNSNQNTQTPTGSTDSQKETENIASNDILIKKGSIDSYSSKGPSDRSSSDELKEVTESGNFKSAVKPNIMSETSVSNTKDNNIDPKKESMMSPSKKKNSEKDTVTEEKPYDEGGGLSLDDLKKSTTNPSRNIKSVNSIDKNSLERILEELNK